MEKFTTRDQRMLAQFFEKLFKTSGRRKYPFVEILHGLNKFGVDVVDWKVVFDEFLSEGFLVKDGSDVILGPAFDYLNQQELMTAHISSGLLLIRDVCEKLLPQKDVLSKTLPDQVAAIEEMLRSKNE